ncbi:MAG: transposase, partial [Ectothiorhodospira sp.]
RIKKWPERWVEEGREEGRHEARQETARNLIRLGVLRDEQIAEATGLTESEIQALRGDARH